MKTAELEILKCGSSPCESCPYKRSTPPGIWAPHEYEKLPAYDGSTGEQFAAGAKGVFLCHAQPGRLCAGWVGTHDMAENLALRLAQLDRSVQIDPMVYTYESPVPLYASGAEACAAGMAGVERPSAEAEKRVKKLMRLPRLQDQERRKRNA